MLLISFSVHQGGLSLCSWLAHLILSINGLASSLVLPPHPVCEALSLITPQAA